MQLAIHFLLFVAYLTIIWAAAGFSISSIDRLAKSLNRSSFAISFLFLGLLTSLSEMSVATNSLISQVPQISAGNLLGASAVIFLIILPFLAIFGKGVKLSFSFSKENLLLSLIVVLIPSIFVLDGVLTIGEGIIMIASYFILLYLIERRQKTIPEHLRQKIQSPARVNLTDISKIIGGAIFIFFAGKLLVDETIYLSQFMNVPPSIIGLLALSIGTNVPEIVIAIRAIAKKNKDIAFGDYIGSATVNTLIFGILILINGKFILARSEFAVVFIFSYFGLLLFYLFSRTKNEISVKEGIILGLIGILFFALQIINF